MSQWQSQVQKAAKITDGLGATVVVGSEVPGIDVWGLNVPQQHPLHGLQGISPLLELLRQEGGQAVAQTVVPH